MPRPHISDLATSPRNGGPKEARRAGLRYVSDTEPGIRRRRSGGGFVYRNVRGRTIAGEQTLKRIRSLAIPPAYIDVWICLDRRGHIQATGRDARGRKQYKYHPEWRTYRDESKYARMADFAAALPAIRQRVARDLRRRGLSREKVLASAVRVLETTLMRIGNEQYKRENNSFGLTTLRNRHVAVTGRRIAFSFRGKGGKPWKVDLSDPRLARVIKRCQELPGQELFQYVDPDGILRRVSSDDVNAYIRDSAGADFSAKDFRTWAGTVLARDALMRHVGHSRRRAKRCIKTVMTEVAERLGNTVAICRKCYIHPAVIDAFLDGTLVPPRRPRMRRRLSASEAELAMLLRRRH